MRSQQQPLETIYENPYAAEAAVAQNQYSREQEEILRKIQGFAANVGAGSRHAMKMVSGRSNLMTPDNNIWFIDNDSIVRNPRPERTPPPPIWGEEEELDEHQPGEAFINPSAHNRDWSFLDARSTRKKITKEIDDMYEEPEGPAGGAAVASSSSKTILVRTSEGRQSQVGVRNEGGKSRKLKKKVVYVYESDSGSDGERRKPPKHPQQNNSAGALGERGYANAKQHGVYKESSRLNYAGAEGGAAGAAGAPASKASVSTLYSSRLKYAPAVP